MEGCPSPGKGLDVSGTLARAGLNVQEGTVCGSSYCEGHSNLVCILQPSRPEEPNLFRMSLCETWASLGAQLVGNLPAMPETQVQFLGQGDLLEKG